MARLVTTVRTGRFRQHCHTQGGGRRGAPWEGRGVSVFRWSLVVVTVAVCDSADIIHY